MGIFRSAEQSAQTEVIRALGRLEGKMDMLLKHVDQTAIGNQGRDDRLSAIETSMTRVKTFAMAGAFFISTLVPIILSVLKIT